MAPDAGVHVEVTGEIALIALVAPEVQGHGRQGLRAHELADFTRDGLSVFVPGLDRAPEQAALHLTGNLRQLAVAADEGAREVGAAGDVAPPDVTRSEFLEFASAPTLNIFRQGRPGRAQCAHGLEPRHRRQVHPRLHAVGEEGRTGAEEGDAQFGGKAPERGPVGVLLAAARIAIVEAAGRAIEEPRDLRVPHHPTGGAVPVIALAPGVGVVAAAHVVVQDLQGQGNDDGAAVTVHDGLGQTGGAAGIGEPQRVIEGQPHRCEGGGGGLVGGESVRKAGVGPQHLQRVARYAQVVMHDEVPHAGQGRAQFGHGGRAVDVAAAIAHAVAGDQHLGLDLLEAIEHGVRPHVGRAHAPDRAEAGAGQEGDDGLGNVGQVGGDAIARLHALRAQVQGQRRDLAMQFRPADFTMVAALVAGDERRKACGVGGHHVAEHLLHVIALRALEPARAGHARCGQHRAVWRGRLQFEEIPDALPEGRQVGGGPPPHRVIGVKVQAALVAQPVLIQANLGNERGAHGRSLAAAARPDGSAPTAHPS